MPLSKEIISIVEALAYKIHEVELQCQRLRLKIDENEELRIVFDGLKSQIGRFFMKHVDRRAQIRPSSTIVENYKSYWGLEKRIKSVPEEETSSRTTCKFCGSIDVKERRNSATGEVYWYCTRCRQESRFVDTKLKE